MRRSLFAASMVGLCVLAACGSSGGTTGPGGTPGGSSRRIVAAQGGVIESGGTRLTIPPGALSQDTTVTLDVRAKPVEPDSNPLRPVGPAVNVDLGGATLQSAATLDLPVTDTTVSGSPVILETRPSDADGEPLLWLHAAKPVPAALGSTSQQAITGTGTSSSARHALIRTGMYSAYIVPKPSPTEVLGAGSLQVPFYFQAGLPWCTATSLAMTLNYFKPIVTNPQFPSGYASNFGLASLVHQSPADGAGVADFLQAMNVPSSQYRYMRWDAELIPNDGNPSNGTYNAFVSYAVLATTGVFGLATPRPVWTSSDRQWHAFVITGVNSDALYINDSNAIPGGGPDAQQSIADFRAANCTLKDKKDPSKGCVATGGGNAAPDLYTLLFDLPVRPESGRRGSLMLRHGQTVYFGGSPAVFGDSFLLASPAVRTISDWGWDGAYPNGYYFDDGATRIASFPSASNLPQSPAYGRSLFRSTQLRLNPSVVNVTNIALTYGVDARLETASGASVTVKHVDVTVNPYTAGAFYENLGTLGAAFPGISGTFDARLTLTLTQDGVVQDVKVISFSVAPDPTDPPSVRILVPSAPTTLIKGIPFTFQGEGFDAHTLPDGKASLTWTEGGVTLGSGATYTLTPMAAGTRTLTLVGTGEYGNQASASVTVTVIDPTLTPGQITIVQPRAGQAFWSPTTNQSIVNVPLAGVATYSDGTAVPGARLVWTAQAQGDLEREVGRGASVTAPLGGGRNTPLPYVIRLTVLSAAGTPIGSTTVNITVGYTYIG